MSEVTEALRALQAGERTLDEVRTMFLNRNWPSNAQPPPKDARELAAREHADRDPDPEGSFAEVAQAFYTGIITVDQYEVLAEAAAGATGDTEVDTETDPEAESPQVSDAPTGDTEADTETDTETGGDES